MKLLFSIVSILFVSGTLFAANPFSIHTCFPVNPDATDLERIEIVGRFADATNRTVSYSAKIKFLNTFSTSTQMELPVKTGDDGKIGQPMVYVASGLKLSIDYYAAPGGNGSIHLGSIDFKTNQSGKISGPVVCKATLSL